MTRAEMAEGVADDLGLGERPVSGLHDGAGDFTPGSARGNGAGATFPEGAAASWEATLAAGVRGEGKVVDAMLEEYRALRDEIALYHGQQKQAINFSLVAFAAFSSFVSSDAFESELMVRKLLFLSFPLFIYVNGFMFIDRSVRVKRIAAYLHNDLRPRMMQLLGGYPIWHWEIYKRVAHARDKRRIRVMNLLLDYVRVGTFVLFAGVSFVAYGLHGFAITAIDATLIGINALMTIAFVYSIFAIQETSGSSPGVVMQAVDLESERQMHCLPEDR